MRDGLNLHSEHRPPTKKNLCGKEANDWHRSNDHDDDVDGENTVRMEEGQERRRAAEEEARRRRCRGGL